jgi:DNA-binding transcriptional ArsR family regulator
MNVSSPQTAVTGSAVQSAVLAVLAASTKAMTGREVARLASVGSDRGVRLALNRLAEQGIVETQQVPPAVLYKLNREHIAAPIVMALAGLRAELLKRLREGLAGWQVPAAHASMFGSAARGDGGVDSDIDLFVVRPASVEADDPVWRGQVDAISHDIERWTGNHASISEVGEADLTRLAGERPPIVDDLVAEAITLAGLPAGRLFSDASARSR